MRVVQLVDLLASLFLGADEAEISEYPKMLGYRWLLHVGLCGELLDRPRTSGEEAKELDPASGGQTVHRVGDEVGGFSVDGRKVDVVPLGDLRIIAKKTCATLHVLVCSSSKRMRALGGRAGEQQLPAMEDEPRSKSFSQLARADLLK
jgi:hypothetical protein